MENFFALEPLVWDTNFFGKKIAKINLPNEIEGLIRINHLIKESPFDLVYCFAQPSLGAPDQITKLLEGATWVDGKVTYLKEVQNLGCYQSLPIQSTYKMEEKLFDLAVQTGVYSRFHTDGNFKNDLYVNLYKKWIENSVNRNIAKEVAIWCNSELIEGMITIGEKNGRADIGLVGVDAAVRGKGIATQLLKYAEVFAGINGYKEIQVVTQQQNEPACRLYEKNGFKIESLVNIFHYWKRA